MSLTRIEQLSAARELHQKTVDFGQKINSSSRIHLAQTSHLLGLYQEVEKLTKSKSPFPVTDMVVGLANDLLGDSKAIVFRDTYLDRLRSFVPAGDNPTYPEVLIFLRTLQQSLARFGTFIGSESDRNGLIEVELRTIVAALEIEANDRRNFDSDGPHGEPLDEETEDDEESKEDEGDVEYEDDPEDEENSDDDEPDEYQEYVRKSEVFQMLDGKSLADNWFARNSDGDLLFRFNKLDRSALPIYLPPTEGVTYIQDQS